MEEERNASSVEVHSVGVAPTTALRQPTKVACIAKDALTHDSAPPANPYIPQTLFHAIHAAASQIVKESGDDRMFRSMRPSSLYALGVLAHEYTLHVADLHIDSLDKEVANAFEEIDAAEDAWIRGGCVLPADPPPAGVPPPGGQSQSFRARAVQTRSYDGLSDPIEESEEDSFDYESTDDDWDIHALRGRS